MKRYRVNREAQSGIREHGPLGVGPCIHCLVYPVRPMRCRAQNSPDVEACRRNYLGQRETIPLFSEIALLYMYVLVILGSRNPNGQTVRPVRCWRG